MRSYRESADPNSVKTDEESGIEIFGHRIPTMYRTWIAIGSAIGMLLLFIIIAARSGGYHPEGGRAARAVVINVDGLNPKALQAAMKSNKAPNLQALTALGQFALCDGETSGCAESDGVQTLLNGKVGPFNASDSSFLKIARANSMAPAVIAPKELFSGADFDTAKAECSRVGILDRECSGSACVTTEDTCNRARKFELTADSHNGAFDAFVDSIKAHSELIYVQVNGVNAAGKKSSRSASSLSYLSSIYLADSLVGNALTVVRDRSAADFENWLVVVTSSSSEPTSTRATSVPFFIASFTDGKPNTLSPLGSALSTADVLPTLGKWFSTSVPADVDGKVQGICSSGVLPKECPQ